VTTLPMFPLGSVLLPHQPLALHVFEPRYRTLVHRCLAGDRTFGVVLIERGSEVGGGDVRFDIACTAHIVDAEVTPDGRWGLQCTGGERVRVVEWLPDDPHPVAEVDRAPDGEWTADAGVAMEQAIAAFGRVLLLAERLGAAIDPAILDLPGPAVVDHWLLAGRAPVGDLDRLALLAADTPERRLDLLGVQLGDLEAVLASRLDGG
jgi:ATP-dependent Lon protease